jgi:hypothetical protein
MIGIRSAVTRRLLLVSAAAMLGFGVWSAQAKASYEEWTCDVAPSSLCAAPISENYYETVVVPSAAFDVALGAYAGPANGFGLANDSNGILPFMGVYSSSGTGESQVYNYDPSNYREVTVYSYY